MYQRGTTGLDTDCLERVIWTITIVIIWCNMEKTLICLQTWWLDLVSVVVVSLNGKGNGTSTGRTRYIHNAGVFLVWLEHDSIEELSMRVW